MKVLVGYDGSDCARAAVRDLALAGLPEDVQAQVVTAAETRPELSTVMLDPGYGASFMDTTLTVENAEAIARATQAEATTIGEEGVTLLRELFPKWVVASQTSSEPAAVALLDVAEQWHADLIVVGSHGRSAVARVFYGSVSQKVMRYAKTSIRIARGRSQRPAGPPRLLAGFDASAESHAVLRTITGRQWPAGTEVRVLTVLDPHLTRAFPRTLGQDLSGNIQSSSQKAAEILRDAGLMAAPLLRQGDPKRAIITEAEHWNADCVFVGAHGLGATRRFLLGTAAASVVSRAHCSVELIRV